MLGIAADATAVKPKEALKALELDPLDSEAAQQKCEEPVERARQVSTFAQLKMLKPHGTVPLILIDD